jgi:hypothetical protein
MIDEAAMNDESSFGLSASIIGHPSFFMCGFVHLRLSPRLRLLASEPRPGIRLPKAGE